MEFFCLAFPNHQNVPSEPSQRYRVLTVSLFIPLKLRNPVVLSRSGNSSFSTAGVLMPKTPVNENSLPSTNKHYVGPSRGDHFCVA